MFAEIVLGHLAGDYLFQSKSMALKKTDKNLNGLLWCVFHCLIYTASVCLFVYNFSFLVVTLVFLSHFFIDRWSLASKWLRIIRGRSITEACGLQENREVNIAFSCLVYAVVDNTLHLILLWLIAVVMIL